MFLTYKDVELYCTAITSPNGRFSNQLKDRPSTSHGRIRESAAHLISVQSNHIILINLKVPKNCNSTSVQVDSYFVV